MTRNRATGRYSFEGQWERLCVCGRTLGVHDAEPPHAFADFSREELANGGPECDRFRPRKKGAKS